MTTVDKSLNVNPFEGDFGDGEVLLGDNIVKARKDHPDKCYCCGGDIKKGERHRAMREVWEIEGQLRLAGVLSVILLWPWPQKIMAKFGKIE